jgi:hypothetical protein
MASRGSGMREGRRQGSLRDSLDGWRLAECVPLELCPGPGQGFAEGLRDCGWSIRDLPPGARCRCLPEMRRAAGLFLRLLRARTPCLWILEFNFIKRCRSNV